jgi:hypothetical protein
MREIFDIYSKSVGTLIDNLPGIHKAAGIKEPLEKMPGWDAFLGRPQSFVESGGRPMIVGTLFGPTGSGKSALFRNLTGIPVPSDLIRPTSYSCVVAAPEGVDQNDLQKLFPNYRISVMISPEVLREKGRDELFYAFYKPQQTNGSTVNLVLADVPDFNSVDQENWAKAEQMLARSEVVVFVTYPEAYKDERLMINLVTACQTAGHLVFVLNKIPPKTPREDAIKIWEDLLAYTKTAERFAEKRHSDGLTLHEFLAKTAVYYLPHGVGAVPELNEMAAIRDESPGFSSLLTGLDAAKIILTSLMEVTPGGVATSKAVLTKATGEKDRLSCIAEAVAEQIGEQAEWVAGTFPVGRWAELISAVAKEERPAFLRPLSFISAFFTKAIQELREFFSKEKSDLRPREDIERERLRDATAKLVDLWRSAYKDMAEGGSLSAESCRNARDAFAKVDLPPVGQEWDQFVRTEALRWSKEHPVLSAGLASLSDLLAVGGVTVVALDLIFGSHVPGPHHWIILATTAAGISGATGILIKSVKTLHLDVLLEHADTEWRKTRKVEIQNHIQSRFADPLFINSVKERFAALESAPIQVCLEACAALEELEQT